jgi:hypothetical protein
VLTGRVFRLFVSSTFSDFIAEREALQQEVFPKLERYCAERGARFEAVDLRWGITEEAQREHDTMRICLEEVRRCQQLSPRPNFAVLLGDRYGWEPVPARIPQVHWLAMNAAATATDWAVIDASYRIDENAIPPVHCLRERPKNLQRAFAHETKLLHALRLAAKGFRGGARVPYFTSATHQEIVLGALSQRDEQGQALDPGRHVHVYVRHLQGVPYDASAKEFIDWDASTDQVVPGARERLRGLETQLRRQLGDHVHDVQVPWRRHGRDGAVSQAFLKRFCDAFLKHQKQLIDAELAAMERTDDSGLREAAHQAFGAERARVFAGRQVLLTQLDRHILDASVKRGGSSARGHRSYGLCVLVGGGGSGKSALVARAAQHALQHARLTGAKVVQRYIAGVPGTESLVSLLTHLTADITRLYGKPQAPVVGNVKALSQAFEAALSHASAQHPLILYLDAVDQLDRSDGAWMLAWLPTVLPDFVRLVVSVRQGTSVEQAARRRYPRDIIYVPPMKPAEGRAMLDAWLEDKRAAWFNAGIAPAVGRRLTAAQRAVLLTAFDLNGSALWLKLAYEEAATWASWDKPRKLPTTVHGLIADLVDKRLIQQENHPQVFTERALAYLCASRFGLSDNELARALGTDPAVRAEFRENEKTNKKWSDDQTLPPILWSRLYFDLKAYLGLSQLDGALLMRWFHREFEEVLRARYLNSQADRQVIHGALAETFGALDRASRPLAVNDEMLFRATDVSGTQVSTALRRVMEQPWQLAMAQRPQELLALLEDLGFCLAKCAANRSSDLVADLVRVRSSQAHASPWLERVAAWNHVLSRADATWPAHRILLQLVLEAPQLEQHRVAWEAFQRRDLQWPVYLKGVGSRYSAPLALPVRLPLEGFVFEDRLDSTFKGRVMFDPAAKTLKIETLSRQLTNIHKVALVERRYLLVANGSGQACLSDLYTGEVLEMGPLKDVVALAPVPARSIRWTALAKDPIGDERAAYSVREMSMTPGSAPFPMRGGKGAVILGKSPVLHLTDLADASAKLLACDGNLFLVYPEDLLKLEVGVYNYLGEQLSTADSRSLDYERFGSIVFVDDEHFLSLGFQGVSGDGRENIQLELFRIQSMQVTKVGDIYLDNTIDLPVPLLAGTKDGGIFLTCENYMRSFAFWPPFESENFAEQVTAYWYRNDLSGKPRFLIRYKAPYAKNFHEEELAWTAEGPFGKWPSIHLSPGHRMLDPDADDSLDFLVLGAGGAVGRWYSDVPLQFAIRSRHGAVLVIRSTGPVMVRRATRRDHVATH